MHAAPCPHKVDCVQAWPLLCAPPEPVEDAAWLVASVPEAMVSIADWDLTAAAQVATAQPGALQAAFEASLIPVGEYRAGQYRRPEALVAGDIPADRLALLTSADGLDCEGNERAYGRQLHQLLRAIIGAPSSAPLAALVAAAIARGHAMPIAAYNDNGRQMRMYRVDRGSAHFAFDPVLARLSGGDEGDAGTR